MEQLSQSPCHQQDDDIRLLACNLKFLGKGPFSLAVKRSECVGLSGQSGVGKTLLLKALTDLIPYAGELFLDGVKSLEYQAPEWRSKVTMVPAESFWWYDGVGEHFAGGKDSAAFENIFERLGFQIDVLDWQVSRMSTGERQRLALLRSLQNEPVVVLLDEPTSNLDSHHTELVEAFIHEYQLKSGCAMVWVSHDPKQLERVATRHFLMTDVSLMAMSSPSISTSFR